MSLLYPCKTIRTTFSKNALRFKIYSFISNFWHDQTMMFLNIDQRVIFCLFILKLISGGGHINHVLIWVKTKTQKRVRFSESGADLQKGCLFCNNKKGTIFRYFFRAKGVHFATDFTCMIMSGAGWGGLWGMMEKGDLVSSLMSMRRWNAHCVMTGENGNEFWKE